MVDINLKWNFPFCLPFAQTVDRLVSPCKSGNNIIPECRDTFINELSIWRWETAIQQGSHNLCPLVRWWQMSCSALCVKQFLVFLEYMYKGLCWQLRVSNTVPAFLPLSPDRDENEISLCIITPCLNIQVMRIKEVYAWSPRIRYLDIWVNSPY